MVLNMAVEHTVTVPVHAGSRTAENLHMLAERLDKMWGSELSVQTQEEIADLRALAEAIKDLS